MPYARSGARKITQHSDNHLGELRAKRVGTDRDWEKWGGNDPYFGVCSEGRFHAETMTPEARAEFFRSGEAHVERTWWDIERLFGVRFVPASVLDFGCGVGRLVIPFARRADRVVGVDISPAMLAEAGRNCAEAGVTGVELIESDDSLSRVRGEFGLVHSHIVLQHIPWKRGRQIVAALATHVAPGGMLAVQLLSGYGGSPLVRGLVRLRYVFPPANWLRNLLRGRPLFEPAMQLHVYDLDEIKATLAAEGFVCVQVEERLDGFSSTLLYARHIGQHKQDAGVVGQSLDRG